MPDRPHFKKGSVFYEGSDDDQDFSSSEKRRTELDAAAEIARSAHVVGSRNAIFLRDFSSTPPASSAPIAAATTPPETTEDPDKSAPANYKPKRRDTLPAVVNKIAPVKDLTLKSVLEQSKSLEALARSFDSLDIHSQNKLRLNLVRNRSNLLGEGRYAQVFRAQMAVDSTDLCASPASSMASTPISTPSSASPTPTSDELHESRNRKWVAVKILHANDDDAQANGIAEVYILQKLRAWGGHSNIISLLGVHHLPHPSSQSKQVALVLEYCRNGNLFDYLMTHPHYMTLSRCLKLSLQVASAVAFLHSGNQVSAVVHHDIKPQNILLTDEMTCRLADFGNAALISPPTALLKDGIGKGTQAYTAPEILRGLDGAYTLSADVYSLGCTFYTLLTGREPFSDVRNPAYQLVYIRRGFFESGSNPLVKDDAPDSAGFQHASPTFSLSSASYSSPSNRNVQSPLLGSNLQQQFHHQGRSPGLPENAYQQAASLYMMLNDYALSKDPNPRESTERQVLKRLIELIRRCTALEPSERPSATDVVRELEELDRDLRAGGGDTDSVSLTSPAMSDLGMSMPVGSMDSTGSSPRAMGAGMMSGMGEFTAVERSPAGRRPFYL